MSIAGGGGPSVDRMQAHIAAAESAATRDSIEENELRDQADERVIARAEIQQRRGEMRARRGNSDALARAEEQGAFLPHLEVTTEEGHDRDEDDKPWDEEQRQGRGGGQERDDGEADGEDEDDPFATADERADDRRARKLAKLRARELAAEVVGRKHHVIIV